MYAVLLLGQYFRFLLLLKFFCSQLCYNVNCQSAYKSKSLQKAVFQYQAMNFEYFEFPATYTDLQHQSTQFNRLTVKRISLPSSQREIIAKLRAIDNVIFNDIFEIKDSGNFDFLYTMIRQYSDKLDFLSMKTLEKLGQTIHYFANTTIKAAKNLRNQNDAVQDLRTIFKMSIFLAFYYTNITAIKKSKAPSGDLLQAIGGKQKPKKKVKNENIQMSKAVIETLKLLIKLFQQSLHVDFVALWQRKPVQTQFFKKYTQICIKVLESNLGKDEEINQSMFHILDLILKANTDIFKSIQIALINLVYENEVPDNLVAFFSRATGSQLQRLCTETIILIVVYLLQKSSLNAQSSSVRNTKQFLSKLSEKMPKIFYTNLSCFIRLYESDSYHLRNAISDILMNILRYVIRGNSQDMTRTRQKFIATLLQRIYDKSSYCRSHVLGVLAQLAQEKTVQKQYLILFLKAGVDRVKDNSVNTRKKALQLINILIDELCPDRMRTLTVINRELQMIQMDKKILAQQEKNTRKQLQTLLDNDLIEKAQGQLKTIKKTIKKADQDQARLLQQKQIVSLIGGVVSTVQVLLGSKTQTDVLETIRLFIRLNKLNCQNAKDVLPNIRLLIFSKEKKIRDQVLATFMHLHLSNHKSQQTAKQLIKLFVEASTQDKSALQQILEIILTESINKGVVVIRPQVFGHLWNYFIQCQRQQSKPQEKRVILTILRVAFSCDVNNVKQQHAQSFLNILKKHIQTGVPDFHVLKQIAKILLLQNKIISLAAKNFLLAEIYILVGSQGTTQTQWYSAAEHVLTSVFQLCENPQKLTEIFLKKMHANLQKKNNAQAISQFIFVLGHSCLKMLIHLDSIENKIKSMRDNQNKQDDDEEQLDKVMGGQQAQLQKKIQQIQFLAQEIIQDPFVSRWVNIIQKIVQNIGIGDEVQIISVLTYTKFMCISSHYCQKELPKLLKLLARPRINPAIKNNIIIGVGDLLHRFPNIVEPYSKHLYQNLKDSDPRVRKTTLTVLTHLSLNDMIKVKGDMCQIALLLQDSNADIQSLVKQFFHQMNKKDPKIIYNLIPDALVRFSSADIGDQKCFENFMKNISPLLQKDKYSESLIGKLCERLSNSLNLLQIKNTAYCLSQININEKGIRKILENFDSIRPKLQDPEVQNYFKIMMTKLKKNLKPQTKNLIEELQDKISNSRQQVFNVDEVRRRNQKVTKKMPRRRRHGKIKIKKNGEQEEDDDLMEIQAPSMSLRERRNNNHMIMEDQGQYRSGRDQDYGQ